MFDKLLKFFIILTPLAYLPDVPFNILDIKLFHLAAICLLAATFISDKRRDLMFSHGKMLFSLIALCVFNLLCHKLNPVVFTMVLNIFFGVMSAIVIYEYAEEPKNYYSYIVAAGLINIALWSFQNIGYNPILIPASDYHGAMLGNAPRFTTYLSVILPFMLSLSPILFIICLAVTVIAKESAMVAVAFVLIMVKAPKAWQRMAVLLLFAIASYIFMDKVLCSINNRFSTWLAALDVFFAHPLAGCGLGVFPLGKTIVSRDAVLYGSFLQYAVYGGVFFVAWIFFALKKFFSAFFVSAESLSILAVIVLSLAEYPLEIPRLWFTLLAIVGFYLIKRSDYAKSGKG